MGCFWFPLEAAALALLPKMATTLEDGLLFFEIGCNFPCDLLKKEGTGMFVSYLLSFLILVAALHATRVINLTLLSRLVLHTFIFARRVITLRIRRNRSPVSVCLSVCLTDCRLSGFIINR